jgi:hypothetical protein
VHIAPASAGSREGSGHFGSYVRSWQHFPLPDAHKATTLSLRQGSPSHVVPACNIFLLYGLLQMNYEDFCHIATVCMEQIGQKCKRFFSPSNFMKFEKDDSGRIAILPFYLYVMRTVSYFH